MNKDEEAELAAVALAAGEDVLHPHAEEAERGIQRQMATLYHRDLWMTGSFVVLLVIVLPFVFVAVWDDMPNTGTRVVLLVAGVFLLVYNLGSQLALLRNYRRDYDFIYRRDVAYLREQAVARELMAGQR
ncbi:MAG: hypothetical protein ACRDNS_06095 [Trebonia sp.]